MACFFINENLIKVSWVEQSGDDDGVGEGVTIRVLVNQDIPSITQNWVNDKTVTTLIFHIPN